MQYTKDFDRVEEWISSLENETGCSFRTKSGRLKDGVYLMAIVRGLPGSGKSTIADYICKNFECSKLELDEFMKAAGIFVKPSVDQLIEIQKKSEIYLLNLLRKDGMAVVSNTSLTLRKALDIFRIANTVSTSCKVLIIEPSTEWAQNISELENKNVHRVPSAKIKEMARNYFPLKQGIFPLGQKLTDSTKVEDQ
jgi:predicted kinase